MERRKVEGENFYLNITVVGLGHLGSVAAAGLATAGHSVTGVDIDRPRIDSLCSGTPPLYEPGLESWLRSGLKSGNLRFSHRDGFIGPLGEVVVITTGTPIAESGAADLSQVWDALTWLRTFDLRDVVLVMKSTVPPGTGSSILREIEGTGARYVSNPEFLREGRALKDWRSPQRIVIGVESGDELAIEAVTRMYVGADAPLVITDLATAEMIKYASNAFLATRISFINEIAAICDQVGASVDVVSQGLSLDSRMGSRMRAGIGYGGSCFPKDVSALDQLASSEGLQLHLLRSVIHVNNRQRSLPFRALRRRLGTHLSSSTVAVLGLSFKPGTDDIREAASLCLATALVNEGATVRAFDPQANDAARNVLPSEVIFAGNPVQACFGANAVVLLTEWEEIVEADWRSMAASMKAPKFLFDGRNALDGEAMLDLEFEYVGIGRGCMKECGSPIDVTRL